MKKGTQTPDKIGFAKRNWKRIGLGLICLDLAASAAFLAFGGPTLLSGFFDF